MRYIYLVAVVLSIWIFTGCNNAEYQITENSIYFADAAGKDKATTITMENGADIKIIVRLAQKSSEDVTVGLQFNSELLNKYNAENGTEYQPFEVNKLPKDIRVTIPAGEISAGYTLHIDDFDTEGINYAVPIELGEVISGGVQKSISQGQYIYLLQKPLIVSVPVMNGQKGRVDAAPLTNWGITCTQWTLEAWVYMDGFNKNNQALFRAGNKEKDSEIYIRYGDANKPYNYLNIKTFGAQSNTEKNLEENTWYHWAFVFDGVDMLVYRNGELDLKYTPKPVSVVYMDYVQMICSGSYFRDNCCMSQVRLWSVARSQTEIKNNMYFEVNPKNPNLIALWPMDEGEGSFFRDATGNGHDATAAEGVVKEWKHDIRFDK